LDFFQEEGKKCYLEKYEHLEKGHLEKKDHLEKEHLEKEHLE